MPCEQRRQLELQEQLKKDQEKKRKEKALKVLRDQAKKMGWKLIEIKPGQFVATKPFSNDRIEIEITKTGIIKTQTDKISAANHANAEGFLLNIARDMGGKWNIRHRHGRGAEHTHHLHA